MIVLFTANSLSFVPVHLTETAGNQISAYLMSWFETKATNNGYCGQQYFLYMFNYPKTKQITEEMTNRIERVGFKYMIVNEENLLLDGAVRNLNISNDAFLLLTQDTGLI